METAAVEMVGEVRVFRHMARAIHWVTRSCADGLSQEESLIQPEPEGNCLNWVMGHLLVVYDRILPLLGQDPVIGVERLKRYRQGAPPLREPGEALELKELMIAWDEAAKRMEAGLMTLTPERLDEAAPFSPSNYPKETMRSLLSSILFHQSYHAGQAALLRRMAGKPGVIG